MFRLALVLLFSYAVNANEPSLYSSVDNVKILNNDTLELQLRNSNKSQLVQFINYFCGDCRRFAGTFKQLAWRLYDWQRILSISVVDCAQERNVRICRDFDIRKTPTLRVFPPELQLTGHDHGFELDTLVPDEIRLQLAEFITEVQYKGSGQPNFASLSLLDDKTSLLKQCSDIIKFIVVVYQPMGSTLGRDTILDLLPWPSVAVRLLNDRLLLKQLGLTPNKLHVMECYGEISILQPRNDSVMAYVGSVAEFLRSKGYAAVAPLMTTPVPSADFQLIDEEQAAILATVLQGMPKVYRADLEQAIDKVLHIELPKVRIFENESLLALRQLLNVLRLFSPLNHSGTALLARLHEFVEGFRGTLSGAAFQAHVQLQERKLPKVFKARRYVGCIASVPLLRGFTCSLWTLFHHLTVQSARTRALPPGYVLSTINGFVKHFFGCKDCVRHFMGMAERRNLSAVNDRDEEILWLWEAHNEVNERLAGDSTEDPKFPKLQFPSYDICHSCEKNSTWQRFEVLNFLKGLYDVKKLSSYGLPTAMGYD